jgi:hypothetical protein
MNAWRLLIVAVSAAAALAVGLGAQAGAQTPALEAGLTWPLG